MISKKFSLITTFVLAATLSAYSIKAQTPTATDAGTIRDSVKQKVTEELSQIKTAVAKKAFVGNVTAKTDALVTITNLLDQTRSALVSTDTTIKLVSGKDGTISDIKVGDFVIAMGDVDSQNSMTTKRLLTIAKPTADKRQAVFGSVTAVSSTSITIQNTQKTSLTIKLSSTTKYTAKTKASDIKVGSNIVVIGSTVNDTSITAIRIHLLTP